LPDERDDPIEGGEFPTRIGHRLRRRQREATRENRETPEERLVLW
jgi:hypothetical protein